MATDNSPSAALAGDSRNEQQAVAAAPGARAWVVLAMLWFVYVLNFLDRQLLSILAKGLRKEDR